MYKENVMEKKNWIFQRFESVSINLFFLHLGSQSSLVQIQARSLGT